MSNEENQKNLGMQSVLRGIYIIGEVQEEKADYISYSGFNIKKGKSVIILESRKDYTAEPVAANTVKNASGKLIDSFRKNGTAEDINVEDAFLDTDTLYVVIMPDNQKEPEKQDAKEQEPFAVQVEKTDGKKKSALPVVILVVAVIACVAGIFLLKGNSSKSGGNNANTVITESSEAAESSESGGSVSPKVGEYIVFGTYEQDNDLSNGNEDIEWLVLDKEDDRIFVISKYVLDCQPYYADSTDDIDGVTWEISTLRKWLNNEFFETAFSAEEQGRIPTTLVKAEDNYEDRVDAGNDTADKVFLLSVSEVETYFPSNESQMCGATEYAIAKGAYTYNSQLVEGQPPCFWWLRSPGASAFLVMHVDTSGGIYNTGSLDDGQYGVRPAMWINIGS